MSQKTAHLSPKKQSEAWWGYGLMVLGIIFWLGFFGLIWLSFKAAFERPGRIMRETKARQNYRSFESSPKPTLIRFEK